MFCTNCKAQMIPGNAICSECGTTQNTAATPPPMPMPSPPSPPMKINKSKFLGFINFEIMITPLIMKIVYIVGVALIGLFMLIGMFSGFAEDFLLGIAMFFVSIIAGVIAQVFWRIACEQIILFFSIHSELKKITKDK